MGESADTPIISFRGVEKSFGASAVLRDLNLDVARHEHLVLIGPSGSGKSTILRILMTLEDIQRGSLVIDGEFLWRDDGIGSRTPSPKVIHGIRQKVGMVFQSFNLFPHMTAIRNVAEAPIRVLRMPKEAAYDRARELLRLVGLADKEEQYPIQLSGGQQQRVAIARCLAMRPQILLFDEVTSALDPETVSEVLNVVRTLAREESFTIVIVTHQMHVAKEIGHRVCFLEGGRIVEEGEPRKMLDNPLNDRTRSFLRAILEA